MEKKFITIALLVVLIIGASIAISALTETNVETKISKDLGKIVEHPVTTTPPVNVTYGKSAIKVPAVDNEGKGVVTWLKVDSTAGEGRTLVNINQLLFWVDTQYSIQIAKSVAKNYTNYDLSNVDIIYTIDTEASLIEGPSAGAALTVATVAALYNKTVDPDIMITGTINPDGTIGPVGGILEKAKASKDVGATMLLVPPGQSKQTYYKQERNCEKIGQITYCTTEYSPVTINITEQADITVKEVKTISEALNYFI